MRHHYCMSKLNYTVGVVGVDNPPLVKIEKKRLTGLIGGILHRYFGLHLPNTCTFIRVREFVNKLDNGTLTGAVRMMQDKTIDSFGRPQSLYLSKFAPELPVSQAAHQDGLYATQVIKTSFLDDASSRSLQMFDIDLFMYLFWLIHFLLIFVILFAMIPLSNRKRKVELIFGNLFDITYSLSMSFSAISLIILFYSLYMMIFKSCIVNNLKSDSVLVDTSDIVAHEEDLLRTHRTFCFYFGEFEHRLIKEAPENSFLWKMYQKSLKQKKPCLINPATITQLISNFNIGKVIGFANLLNRETINVMFANFVEDAVFYTGFEPVNSFNIISAVYFREGIDPFFQKTPGFEIETGLQDQIQSTLFNILQQSYKYKMRVFQYKDEYIDEYSLTQALPFGHFSDLAKLYWGLNFLAITIFIFSKIYNYLFQRNNIMFCRLI